MAQREQVAHQPVRALVKIDIAERLAAHDAVLADVYAGEQPFFAQRQELLLAEPRTDEDYAVNAARFRHLEVIVFDLRVAVCVAEENGVALVARHGFDAGNDALVQAGFDAWYEE